MMFSQVLKSYRSSKQIHHPAIITNVDKDFSKKLDFKDKKFPIKVRDIHRI